MDPSQGIYDKRLLREAALLKSQDSEDAGERRRTYDKQLLKEATKPYPSGRISPNRLEVSNISHHSRAKKPFWRTIRAKVVIALVCLLVIGAIVGGAVGGTVSKAAQTAAMSVTTSPGAVSFMPSGVSGSTITTTVSALTTTL